GVGSLGFAPLHALTLGFFASAVIGMVTRVTLGHSGRPLNADRAVWLIFWGMQGVAVLRVAAEFVHLAGAANPYWLAALGWLAAFGAWYVRFAPIYLKPRPDGQPG
ncbi:MAG: NnrS family protein, partial [Rhodocyclaceae bacterium]|nr:NnrS family protein [Rhodocyclaceae bacterium]